MLLISVRLLRAALRDRQGAVTMDWVVLSAAVIALVFSVGATMSSELSEIASALFLHASDGLDAMQ